MEPDQSAAPPAPSFGVIAVEETADALVYQADGPQSIYLDPKLNHTPVQCGRLMKLRRPSGGAVVFRDASDRPRAELVFPDDRSANITLWSASGGIVWTDTIHAEECLPDSPGIVPKSQFMYRGMPAAFMLFLLLMVPLVWLYLSPHVRPNFVAGATIGVLVVVLACMGALLALRRAMKL